MKISRITTGKWGKTIAFFDIQTSDGLIVKGFKLINGDKGQFIGMPSQKDKDDEYQDVAYFPNQTDRDVLRRLAKEAYAESASDSSSPSAQSSSESSSFTDNDAPPLSDDDIPF